MTWCCALRSILLSATSLLCVFSASAQDQDPPELDSQLPASVTERLQRVELERIDQWMTYEAHPLFYKLLYGGTPVVEAGKIEGGYKVNQVPDWAEAQVDIRLVPGQSPDGVLTQMRALIARLQEEDPELEVSVEPMTTQWAPLHYWETLTDDDPFVRAIREVAPDYVGRAPRWTGSIGGEGPISGPPAPSGSISELPGAARTAVHRTSTQASRAA